MVVDIEGLSFMQKEWSTVRELDEKVAVCLGLLQDNDGGYN